MKILIIGGTRFIGKKLVEKLIEYSHDITVFSRGNNKPTFLNKITHIQGDRNNHIEFYHLFKGKKFDVVIDNIAYSKEDIEIAIKTFKYNITQYILCSSIAVYSNIHKFGLLYEDDANLYYSGGSSYAVGKREAELTLKLMNKKDLPFSYTILRPTVIEGSNDHTKRMWYWIQRINDGKEIIVPITYPSTLLRHIYSEDLINIYIKIINNSKTFNQTYNISGEDIISLEDYLYLIRSILNTNTNFIFVDNNILTAGQINFNFKFPDLFVGERFLPDINKIKNDVGYKPTLIRNWLKKTVMWYINNCNDICSPGYEIRDKEIITIKSISDKYKNDIISRGGDFTI